MKKIIDLTNELIQASSDYYNLGASPLTDKEFDDKLAELEKLEKEYNFRLSSSPTINVGAPVLSKLKKKSVGERPMLSLDKTKTAADIVKLGKLTVSHLSASVKADGLSVRLVYNEKGELVSGVTRGDGYFGTEITSHIMNFLNVPIRLPIEEELIIDGEAIIKNADFEFINKNNQFKNSRNAAAGALNLLDMQEVKSRRLSFIAWDVIQGCDDSDSWYMRMNKAEKLGFEIIPYSTLPVLEERYIDEVNEELQSVALERGIPCDGIVWRIDSYSLGDTLGRTEKFFHNAIAWKPIDEEAETKLEYIDWTMGRNGTLCPVAVFKPVELCGSVVTRASLHNLNVMSTLFEQELPTDRHILTIIKSNLIIPQVIRTKKSEGAAIYHSYPLPTHCPYCQGELKVVETEGTSNLYCPNPSCDGKLINKIDYYCSKKGLDIKNLSKATLTFLIDKGWLTSLKDLYTLKEHRAEWITLKGWGVKSVDRILESIEESKTCKLENFLAALGIPLCGLSITKTIAKECKTYEDFRNRIKSNWDFSLLDKIADSKMGSIWNFNYSDADFIVENYINFIEEEEVPTLEQVLTGKVFVITGKLSAYFKTRDELVKDIESKGGKVAGSVTSKTNYLITDHPDKMTAKSKKAAELGVPVISIDDYINLAN